MWRFYVSPRLEDIKHLLGKHRKDQGRFAQLRDIVCTNEDQQRASQPHAILRPAYSEYAAM
jgi:hypothetical protein